jgi:hypothetical protein
MARKPKSKSRISVEKRLTVIQQVWSKEFWDRSDSEKTYFDRPDAKLKRGVYRLVRDCIKGGCLDILEESAEFQLGGKSHLKPSERNEANPFYWGLTAVCGDKNKLPRTTKSRFAQELLYAHMHDVPSHFLIGFIHQIGPSRDYQDEIDNRKMQRWFVKRQKSAAIE